MINHWYDIYFLILYILYGYICGTDCFANLFNSSIINIMIILFLILFTFIFYFQRISFAKSKSDVIAKKDGSFVVREKRSRDEGEMETSSGASSSHAPAATVQKAPKLVVNATPNRILFIQNLPEYCSEQALVSLFQQYPGFGEVRMVPGKREIAFVEFQDHIQSGIVLQQLNGYKLSATDTLHLTYSKQIKLLLTQ